MRVQGAAFLSQEEEALAEKSVQHVDNGLRSPPSQDKYQNVIEL